MSKNKFCQKAIKVAAAPFSQKIPREAAVPNENNQPLFRADQMDLDGAWGWNHFDPLHLQDLLKKIFESQKLTWQELRDNGSHLVNVELLVIEARKRLVELEKNDLDQLYSLRLTGRKRLWGIKDGNIFWILWWDPNHQVCQSHKKHT